MKRALPLLVVTGLAIAGVLAVSAQPAPDKPAIEAVHFSHANHAMYEKADGKPIDTKDPKQCGQCHAIDSKGKLLAPAAQGHYPCLQSKCHGDMPSDKGPPSFFAVSEKYSKAPKDSAMQKEFERAAAMCLGCHEQVPWAWKKPTTKTLALWEEPSEFHIEMAKTSPKSMDHFDHTQMKLNGQQVGCRNCHAVDKDQKLVKGAPGHSQCVQCHTGAGANQPFGMGQCGNCHKEGSREQWIRGIVEASLAKKNKTLSEKDVIARPNSDVYSCGSQNEAQYAKKGKKAKHCFKHETKEHRTDAKGEEVQCKKCHWMVADKRAWTKAAFSNLADLHINKIIGDPTTSDVNRQHAACGGCHPHNKQIELATAECNFCHAVRTTQEPYW